MLRRFFQDYKILEGKSVEVDEIQHAAAALTVIQGALDNYTPCRRCGIFPSTDSAVERRAKGADTKRPRKKWLIRLKNARAFGPGFFEA